MSSGVAGILNKGHEVKGTVVLMRKNVLGFNELKYAKSATDLILGFGRHIYVSIVDTLASFLGISMAFRLISATVADGSGKGKVGQKTWLKGNWEGNWATSISTWWKTALMHRKYTFDLHFEWGSDMGIPGAFYVESFMPGEFFLVSLTLEDIPNHERLHFVCNSWIYNSGKYKTDRIFFTNKTYLPSETPAPLVYYRQEELKTLRGDGTGERKEGERIYDYDVYNDLGAPDEKDSLARPVLGGNNTLPYPRRVRTGRKPTTKDPNTESRSDVLYFPKDESFSHLKSSDFLVYTLKSGSRKPKSEGTFDQDEFNTFDDVRSLYNVKIKPPTDIPSQLNDGIPFIKELLRTDGESGHQFPPPKVIEVDYDAWMTDEEFAREMIAGVNPHIIKKLQEFPPKSKLDSQLYGDNTSTITKEHLEPNMGGVTVEQALQKNKLFILDHHDPIFPYLRKINATNIKAYATRTILFLQNDGTLKPLAIELSRPHPQGDNFGPVSYVYLPTREGVEYYIWLLAKAYVVVNDSCFHQLVSHWLNTHAVVEPFIIATNRHLSVVHPIHKLLLPHYRDTMNINALARNILINAEGIVESTFLGAHSLEISAVVYKDWVFTEQGLPYDLLKRGVAVEDPASPHGIRLLIEDYPYASDGLEIWAAIKSWVEEYVNFYYKSDAAIAQDSELQEFWKEVVEVGHGDLKNATWWFKMQTRAELIEACSILIWIASALHAAVNFGQYPYGGYILNRPTKSRRFMPEKGSAEYEELSKNFQKVYLRTITPKNDTIKDLTSIEVLSKHASDELYLGKRSEDDWTSDLQPLEAFQRFGSKLAEIEQKLIQRNNDEALRNRYGPVEMPYTLLYPSSQEGLTFRGIPNSISI